MGAIERVHTAAFGQTADAARTPPEAALVDALRTSRDWIARLSFVAVDGRTVVGHVVCTRARLGRDQTVLGLGPIGVLPRHQGAGIGHALMHAVLGADDAMDEPLVGLLGEPAFYRRFGFQAAANVGVEPPDPSWRKLPGAAVDRLHDDADRSLLVRGDVQRVVTIGQMREREHGSGTVGDMEAFTASAVTHLLVVSDTDASRDWYVRVLEASVHGQYGTSVVLELCGTWLLLVTGGQPTPDKPTVTLSPPDDVDLVSSEMIFRVDDCQAAYHLLNARGAQFLSEPVDRGGEIRAFFRDPDGHLLEISELT